MTSLGSSAARLGSAINTRWIAVAHAYELDADLAYGVRPATSSAHQLRADRLHRPRVRRRIARALARAVVDARRPIRPRAPQIPLSSNEISRCERQLLALAESVAFAENPRTQALAIASQLAFDGGGPLFHQPGARGRSERLANTIHAADAAFGVCGDFDEPAEVPRDRLVASSSE
jgi:hypothetical protein